MTCSVEAHIVFFDERSVGYADANARMESSNPTMRSERATAYSAAASGSMYLADLPPIADLAHDEQHVDEQ